MTENSTQASETVLVLGGTGVIGTALRQETARCGGAILSLSLSPPDNGRNYRNLQIDLASQSPEALGALLEQVLSGPARVLAILDVMGLPAPLIPVLGDVARRHDIPVGQVSSCMLYDPSGCDGAMDEATPLTAPGAGLFPYQSRKLAQEAALVAVPGLDWKIFRTNHVLGPGALLGCIPDHNRDPALRERLRSGQPLSLAHAGDLRLSYCDPRDLASAMLSLVTDVRARRQAMNIVHPSPVLAADYYRIIARLMGLEAPQIVAADIDPDGFWSLTARDAVYETRFDFVRDLAFRYDLTASIAAALEADDAAYRALGGFMAARIAPD